MVIWHLSVLQKIGQMAVQFDKTTYKKIRISIGIFSLLIALWMGVRMWNLDFWGYRPLYFFGGIYIGISCLLAPWFSREKENLKYFLISSIGGILLYLGFPTVGFTPLMFIGFVPFLYIEQRLSAGDKTKKRSLFVYTYHGLLLWNILSTFWVANTSFIPSIFAFTLNALFMTVPFLLMHQMGKKVGTHLKMWAFIVFWMAFEWGHLRWEVSWPWLTLGNSFAANPIMIQWYEYTGFLGGSLWILITNVLFFQVLKKILAKEEMHPILLLKPFVLIMGMILWSFYIFATYQEGGERMEFGIVQPNYEPHYEKFLVPEDKQVDRFIELSNSIVSDSLDFLIYPETVFDCANVETLNSTNAIHRVRREVIDSFPNLQLISGLCTYYFFKSGELLTPAARVSGSGSRLKHYEIQNSAAAFSSTIETYPVHIKSRLVPGAEILPYKKLLFFLEPIVIKAGGSFHGLARRDERTVFTHGNFKTAPVICYESVYGEYVGQYIRKGANAIVIMTNDGWWDNTPGHIQHMHFARLRAIEHRRSIARSANTGISCFIDQRGKILKSTKYGEQTAITGKLNMNERITFYTKWGDYLGRISAFLSIAFLMALLSVRFRRLKGL